MLAERRPVNPHIHHMNQLKHRYCRCRPLVVTFVYYEFGTQINESTTLLYKLLQRLKMFTSDLPW